MAFENSDERAGVVDKLIDLLRVEANRLELKQSLRHFHPADIAEALEEIDEDLRHTILDSLEAEQRAEILEESHGEDVFEYIEEREASEIAEIVGLMSPDEVVDMLEHINDEEKVEEVLSRLEPDHAEDVRELREYEPDTAGGIMTKDFFWARAEETAAEIISRIKAQVEEIESINDIFVCREDMKLKGQISVEDLLVAEPDTKASALMDMATITIGHDADQEVAARYMQKYDLELLPVIDSGRRILGVITVDDIIDVLSDEASEDMYRMVGVGDPKPLSHGPFERAYKRLPWLITTIVGMGIIAPFMLNHLFADTLMRVASLALFIPAIMGLGGNTAIQSSTITVRGLATGEIDFDDLFWMIKREIQVGLIIAVVCAVAVGTCAFGVTSMDNLTAGAAAVSALRFGVTVSIAMFVGIISSVLLGTTVPMLCHRFGIDPAVAAGPFITTIIDMGTQTLYLTVATLLLLA